MKIFISHSSANEDYGDALVELLRGSGIKDDKIIFTSNTAYGIPPGCNIFDWLKLQISENPFVIYLLSEEYYKSVACLNEMGAAWIVENEHVMIFTPGFDIKCKEFQNGAIDPREIGFYLDNEDRLREFIQQLGQKFSISGSHVVINQQVKKYLKEVDAIKNSKTSNATVTTVITAPVSSTTTPKTADDIFSKFTDDIISRKLTDEELLLIQYMIDKGDVMLGLGWKMNGELVEIRKWAEKKAIKGSLSDGYSGAVGRLQMRKYMEISQKDFEGVIIEVKLVSEIETNLLDLPKEAFAVLSDVINSIKC